MTLALGARLARRGDTGTVAYVGPLPPHEGIWYGVVWDRAGRGQHDGCGPDGTRYFACAPRQGSFLPSSSHIDTGMAFVDALAQKYGTDPSACARRVASLVGAPPPPAHADASCVYVRWAYPEGAQTGVMPYTQLESVDLSRSLLATWDEVARIAAPLPLHTLVLQHVRLQRAAQVPAAFAHLQHLHLDDTHTDWAQALVLGRAMPALVTLQLAHNAIEALEPADGAAAAFPRLTSLHLGDNCLRDGAAVGAALQPMPSLRHLILSGNEFTTMPPLPRPFPQLDALHLAGQALDASCVAGLATWFAVPNYALVLPPVRGDEETTRWWAIAQLPGLACLNHTSITPQARTEAERYFLTMASPNDPRFMALCAVHGAPVRAAPRTLRDRLRTVRWVRASRPPCVADVSTLRDQSQPISMLESTPVRSVQRQLEMRAATHASAVWAVLAAEPEPLVLALDDTWQDLAWYGVQNDDLLVLVD